MKLMIASDIHGSALFCKRMLEAFVREQADRMLLLGDILYHGPRNDLPEGYQPKEVISLLNPIKNRLLCVRGNCDTEVDQMVLEFPIMAEYCLLELDGITVLASHGHKINPGTYPLMSGTDVLLNGHTHVPACEKKETKDGSTYQYLNPGSVSIPKEGSARGYIVYESGIFSWKNLDGEEYMTWKTDSHF